MGLNVELTPEGWIVDPIAGDDGIGNTFVDDPSTGLPHDFITDGALAITLDDDDEVVVVMEGVTLPRSVFIQPFTGDTIQLRFKYSASGLWAVQGTYTDASTVAQLNISLISPVYAIGVQRIVGTSISSVVEIA